MLNERERRELQEIERSILDADPRLDALFAGHRSWLRWTTSAVVPGVVLVVLCVVATGLTLLGLVAHALVVLIVAAWPFVVLRIRRGARRDVGER